MPRLGRGHVARIHGGDQVGAAQSDEPAPVAAPSTPQAPLVLVVDDSLTVRRVTQRLLLREGYRVTLAKDGMEALERLAEERPAVMLSDIEMPRMNGYELLSELKGDAATREMPVVFLTSRAASKHRQRAEQLGVNGYLIKPYHEDQLLEELVRVTRKN